MALGMERLMIGLRDVTGTFVGELNDEYLAFWEKHLGSTLVDGETVSINIAIRDSEVSIPEGSYLPEELGLYLNHVRGIHIGFCRFKPYEGMEGFHPFGARLHFAHAHPTTGDMCFINGMYIFSKLGVVDEVFIHEYCHILRGSGYTLDHDPIWESLMASYGFEPIHYMAYKYR